MYYHASAIIAQKHPSFADDIERVDKYLADRNTQEFYSTQLADKLNLATRRIDKILELYDTHKVVRLQPKYLCPDDYQEVDSISDGMMKCYKCGEVFSEEDCFAKMYVFPKSPDNPNVTSKDQFESVSEITVEEDKSEEEQKEKSDNNILSTLIKTIGAILLALIAGYFTLHDGVCTNPESDFPLCNIDIFSNPPSKPPNLPIDEPICDPKLAQEVMADWRSGEMNNDTWKKYQPPPCRFEDDPSKALMVLIPRGNYVSTIPENIDECITHTQSEDICINLLKLTSDDNEADIVLEAYWIDLTEVTNQQVKDSNIAIDYEDCELVPEQQNIGNYHPYTCITRNNAQDYCQARNARLPEDYEWEYAARGSDQWIYPWGNENIADRAGYKDDGNSQVESVAQFQDGRSWVQAYDMAGNVAEWVNTTIPDIRGNSQLPIARGGSYDNLISQLRTDFRDIITIPKPVPWIGFRCARSLDG